MPPIESVGDGGERGPGIHPEPAARGTEPAAASRATTNAGARAACPAGSGRATGRSASAPAAPPPPVNQGLDDGRRIAQAAVKASTGSRAARSVPRAASTIWNASVRLSPKSNGAAGSTRVSPKTIPAACAISDRIIGRMTVRQESARVSPPQAVRRPSHAGSTRAKARAVVTATSGTPPASPLHTRATQAQAARGEAELRRELCLRVKATDRKARTAALQAERRASPVGRRPRRSRRPPAGSVPRTATACDDLERQADAQDERTDRHDRRRSPGCCVRLFQRKGSSVASAAREERRPDRAVRSARSQGGGGHEGQRTGASKARRGDARQTSSEAPQHSASHQSPATLARPIGGAQHRSTRSHPCTCFLRIRSGERGPLGGARMDQTPSCSLVSRDVLLVGAGDPLGPGADAACRVRRCRRAGRIHARRDCTRLRVTFMRCSTRRDWGSVRAVALWDHQPSVGEAAGATPPSVAGSRCPRRCAEGPVGARFRRVPRYGARHFATAYLPSRMTTNSGATERVTLCPSRRVWLWHWSASATTGQSPGPRRWTWRVSPRHVRRSTVALNRFAPVHRAE